MALFRKRKESSGDEDSDPDMPPNERRSVLAPPPNRQRKGSALLTFAAKKASKAPKFRNKNKLLTKKQVEKLNSMEPHEIAKNHTYKELEYIVDSLTKLYAQLYKFRNEIREAKLADKRKLVIRPVNATSKNSAKKTRGKSLRRGSKKNRKSRKRKSNRRGSVGALNPASIANTLRRASVNRKTGGRRGSVLRSSVPNFAKFAMRIKNVKTDVEDELPIEQLIEYSTFEVENSLEKTDRALKAHQKFKDKEKKRWKDWEDREEKKNTDCLLEMQEFIPVDLKYLKEQQIADRLNGNIHLARRLSRHKVFHLFNMTYDQLQSVHPADLKNRYHIGGLDLVELRALYSHTKELKRPWRKKLRKKLAGQIEKESKGALSEKERRHPAYSNKPDFNTERKPSVIAFMNRRDSALDMGSDERAPSLVALELQKRYGLPPVKTAPSSQTTTSILKKDKVRSKRKKKIRTSSATEDIKSIYLSHKPPDKPVNFSKADQKRHSNGRNKDSATSDGDSKKKLRKDNIFSNFEEISKSEVNDSRRRPNRPLGEGEVELENLSVEEGRGDAKLTKYFKQREKRKTEQFEIDDEEYEIKANDNEQDLKRKQSELFIKAFEMINSDEVNEEDEVFLKTLRKLSVFTASMSEDELEDELYKHSNEDKEADSESEPESTGQGFYLNAPKRTVSRVSVAESAYTEDEYL